MPAPPSDSLKSLQGADTPKFFNYTHIFSGHELQPLTLRAEPLKKTSLIWPVAVFLLGFILLVIIRVTSAKRFFTLLRAYFTLGAARQLLREDYRLNKASSVLFSIVFLLNFSYFLFKINQYYGYIHYPFNDFFFYLLTIVFVLGTYFFKILIFLGLSNLVLARAETEEYIFNIFLSSKATGLFLFPVIVCLEYAYLPVPYVMGAGLLILLLFYVIRILKGLMIAYVSGRFSVFHLFLYLCALEILPLIVLIKLLVSRIF